MKNLLFLDFETRSELGPGTVGTANYAHRCKPLLLGWAFEDQPARVWDCREPIPSLLKVLLLRDDVTRVAHNSPFDRSVVNAQLPNYRTHRDVWRCSSAKARSAGLPASLDKLGEVLKLSQDLRKLTNGKQLIKLFCQPRRCTAKYPDVRYWTPEEKPEDWALFVEYCRVDVEVMRECWRRTPEINYRGSGLASWLLDQEINDRGLPVDVQLCGAVGSAMARHVQTLRSRVSKATGGVVTAPSQRNRILRFLVDSGLDITDLKADTVLRALDRSDLTPTQREVLTLRLHGSRTSIAKYDKILAYANRGRVNHVYTWRGALRTGRYAGKGIQPQNFPRGTIKDVDQLARAFLADTADLVYPDLSKAATSCLRPVIRAEPGKHLFVSDLRNIEGRVLAWLAGEAWKLEAFRRFDLGAGEDLYRVGYARAFGVSLAEVDDLQRLIGKVQELALGYGGGPEAYATMAETYHLNLEPLFALIWPKLAEETKHRCEYMWRFTKINKGTSLPEKTFLACEALKQVWRADNPRIVKFWAAAMDAFKAALTTPGAIFSIGNHLSTTLVDVGPFKSVAVKLPSGRMLFYHDAFLVNEKTEIINPDTEEKRIKYSKGIRFHGELRSKDGGFTPWVRQSSHGGKLVENFTQAVALDIMESNMEKINASWPLVGTSHDEVISDVAESEDTDISDLNRTLASRPDWAPDIPLAAKGFITKRYRKD